MRTLLGPARPDLAAHASDGDTGGLFWVVTTETQTSSGRRRGQVEASWACSSRVLTVL